MRDYLKSQQTIQDVFNARCELIAANNQLLGYTGTETSWGISLLVNPLFSALDFCCLEESYAKGLMVRLGDRYKRKAIDTADAACYAVARHVGGIQWDAADPETHKAVRLLGQLESDKEREWQIARVIERVSQ